MDRQPSRDEIATMRGRVAVEVDLLRRSAGWARRFARDLASLPPRPDLRDAVRAFLRTAGGLDGRAAAVEATFAPSARGPAPVAEARTEARRLRAEAAQLCAEAARLRARAREVQEACLRTWSLVGATLAATRTARAARGER